jgi:hypothetical protein
MLAAEPDIRAESLRRHGVHDEEVAQRAMRLGWAVNELTAREARRLARESGGKISATTVVIESSSK